MNAKHILSTILLTASLGATAQTAGINERAEEHTSLVAGTRSQFYESSPTVQFNRFATSLSEISIALDWEKEHDAASLPYGDGHTIGQFEASTYLRLGKNAVAFAGAGYQTGSKHNVRWNSTADYRLLYPYIVSDSIGGNLRHEQYHFEGGFAQRASRFLYGLSMSYRAVQEYRRVDPRPRNMATDLSIDASGAYTLNSNYTIDLDASVRIYKQVMDVTYYSNSGANTTQFHYLGMGQTFKRLDGTTFTETRFKGFGYGVNAALLPSQTEGWMLMASFGALKIDRRIHELNEAPVTTLHTYTFNASAGRTVCHGNWTHIPMAEFTIQRRIGDEAVIDNGALGEFKVLRLHEKFHLTGVYGQLSWTASLQGTAGRCLELKPAVTYCRTTEEYADPFCKQTITTIEPSLTARALKSNDTWQFVVQLNVAGRIGLDNEFNIPIQSTDIKMFRYLEHSYERAIENAMAITPAVSVQRAVGGGGAVYLSVKWRQGFQKAGPDSHLIATAGFRF